MIQRIEIDNPNMPGAKELSKEEWHNIADELCAAFPYIVHICDSMKKNTPYVAEMMNVLDPDTMSAYLQAAISACAWVGEYAADKVKFLLVKEGEKN